MPVLELRKVSKSFGGITAVRDVSLSVEQGAILGLIGPNGAGKTTLFNLVTGIYAPTSGEILFGGRNLAELQPHEITDSGLARTFQNIRIFGQMTVLENVMIGRHCRTKAGVLGAILGIPRVRKEEAQTRQRCLEFWNSSASMWTLMRKRPTCPMDSSGSLRSQGRWPPIRNSSCWMSRLPA